MDSGFLLVNKPEGWTSHDVVGYLRKITRIKKIGHAGTLDPFATGLLIVGIERAATKRLDEFKGLDKTYIATLHLGATSDTYDKTGVITKNPQAQAVSRETIEQTLKGFLGEQEQLPPMYSAKKIHGQKLYTLARQGMEVERPKSQIRIDRIDLRNFDFPNVKIEVSCSTGTYIRTLAHDIGATLETGAYCEALERTDIGPYRVENSLSPQEYTAENWKNYLISESFEAFFDTKLQNGALRHEPAPTKLCDHSPTPQNPDVRLVEI